MKKILITTTESLEGWEIVNYLQPIHASQILGSNAFSDFGAAFTDVFGGRATMYERRLQILNEQVVESLKIKARELGANCILGLKVDIDEISGKNMQMFMITGWGTAVVIKNQHNPLSSSSNVEIDKDKINEQANINRLAKASSQDDFKLTLNDLQIIVDSKSTDFKDILLGKFKKLDPVNFTGEDYKVAIKLYNEYFSVLPPAVAIPLFYNDLFQEVSTGYIDKLITLIKTNDLLDYPFIEQFLNSDFKKRKIALNLLLADKPSYNDEDLIKLEKIIVLLKDAFPSKAVIGLKKGFLSSTEKEVWTCECGGSNPISNEYCNSCMKTPDGFRENELKPQTITENLVNKLAALKTLLQ